MKYPALCSFTDLLPQLDQFDAIIDVRTPAEFQEDRLPGAINCPVLDDEQRIQIGTLYKQLNAFEAKKAGAVLVSKNIARHIETIFHDKPRDWKPLVYCWRGGNRSGSMTHILAKIGWPATQLEGGYKEYRRHVNSALAELPSRYTFQVICGTTGSGKSRLLETLASNGAQVLDLEQLAAHRGSVLGNLPLQAQPSQKTFESRLWQLLRHFDPRHVVYVESESKKIGNLRVPEALMQQMRSSACLALSLSMEKRIALLMQDYVHFIDNPDILNAQLDCLVSIHGRDTISTWQDMARTGQIATLVEQLLTHHYDPAYVRSIGRNFILFPQATTVTLPGITAQDFQVASHQILHTAQNQLQQ